MPRLDSTGRWRLLVLVLAGTCISLVSFLMVYRPVDTAILTAAVLAAIVFPPISIWAAYLSTRQNIEELRSSTERQIRVLERGFTTQIKLAQDADERQSETLVKGFSAAIEESQRQSKVISAELRETKEAVKQLTEKIGGQIDAVRAETEAAKQRLNGLQVLTDQRRLADLEHVERIRPDPMVTLDVRPHWFWRHRWLSLANAGGQATDVRALYRYHVQTGWKNLPPEGFDLEPNKSVEWDLGDIGDSRGSGGVEFRISVRDGENRVYEGEVRIPLTASDWVTVTLKPGAHNPQSR